MIRQINILLINILLISLTFVACTSTSEKSSESDTAALTLTESSSGSYISQETQDNVSSKRRGKLSSLQSDGEAWYSFQITESFEELKLELFNYSGTSALIWNTNANSNASENSFQLDNVSMDTANFLVDVVIKKSSIQVFFNEGIESYTFNKADQSMDYKIQVSLNGESRDLPGILYDIGI